MNNYENLQKVLKEIFEMDKADLDFGIYRIMNQKREQVMQFIDTTLPKDIKEILAQTQSKDSASLQAELEQMGKALDSAGVERDSAPKYLALQQQIAGAVDTNALEQEVFSHLASFFKRYYKDGDFISLRRYKKDVYAIPYEGEEVKLHWANHDQYYIKTSEYLKNYTFKLSDGKKVNFVLKEASTEQNNNKTQGDAERRFAIYEESPLEIVEGELNINFTYETYPKSTKQDDLAKYALEIIQSSIPSEFVLAFDKAPTEKNKNRTVIEKHINNFISRNSFDYFIHKDLGGFLSRELDFYIKNEVLFIDDINTENPIYFTAQLSKIKALKTVANKIITFLAQIEDFQKKLWLKKKFVISTNYCITLDRIPESYYPEIVANKAQIDEWKTLFDVDVSKIGVAELAEAEPFLVLDTKHFSQEFKDKLLAEFDDLDEETDGVLINSENFQALNLLEYKYQNQVNCVYTDPPYNTGNDGFAYKDGFMHSSWISLMYDRTLIVSKLINENSGCFLSNIDKRELYNYKPLLDSIFTQENFVNAIVNVNNPKGRSDQKHLPTAHDNILFYAQDGFISYGWNPTNKVLKRYNKLDENGEKYREIDLRKTGDNDRRIDRENLFYYFYYNEKTEELIPYREKQTLIDFREIIPMKDENTEGNWRWELNTSEQNIKKLIARYMPVKKQWSVFEKDYFVEGDRVSPTSVWDEKPFNSERGTESFVSLGFAKDDFPRPKPIGLLTYIFEHTTSSKSLILDFFVGSGTTICAVLELNLNTGSKRKYIGIEMGSYFNNITIPRIKKTIYTQNWLNGKPQDKKGISQIIKYQVLESYEDTLNNLSLPTTSASGLLQFNQEAQEEYLLKYMLDVESEGHLFNIEAFKNPFGYQLNVTENNELVPTTVDLVETFNYLIGLYVQRIQSVKDIKLVEGKTRTGEKTLVIWRNLETTSNEETEKVFRKLYDSVRSAEFDQIYINGDHHFENVRTGDDQFKVKMIEETFFKLMFNSSEL